MCGIFAYTGHKDAGPVLLEGLTNLEYRGYDSAGIYMPEKGGVRAAGAVAELRKKIPVNFSGHSGIAHLRWATHGEPIEKNAHPHRDCGGDVWVVHNGIIENYRELKQMLIKKGHTFVSDTDTEVLAHLVEEHLKREPSFEKAAFKALNQIRGTYGTAIQSKKHPELVIAARMGAPIVLGVGKGENFIASDASPIISHTKQVVYLEDGEVAVLKPDSYQMYTLDEKRIKRAEQTLDWNAEQAQKGGYEHFMLKEIMEGPEVVRNTIRGRVDAKKGTVTLKGLATVDKKLEKIENIVITACGTAYNAGLVGKYMLEEYAGIPVDVELGSEFRYRKPVIRKNTALLAITQSGETADTLEAIREGKRRGALTLGIVNTVGSTIARETDAGIYNQAGPEIGVASTKAFISQLTALAMLTVQLARQRGMHEGECKKIVKELTVLPAKIQSILDRKDEIKKLALKYASARNFLFLGRKYNYAIAFEGALKLKELSYIHAEGCGAGEMKHGPLAMIDEQFPTMAIVPSDSVYEKMLSNVQEIKARRGPVVAIATKGAKDITTLADDVFYVPETIEMLTPILTTVPMHLFSYYFAKAKGYNVDRPRNLAKSVTVE